MSEKTKKVNALNLTESPTESGVEVISIIEKVGERLTAFFDRYHVTEPEKMPTNTFFAALKYAGQAIPVEYRYKSISPPIWDIGHLYDLAAVYIDLCMVYNKSVSVSGFAFFVGMTDSKVFYDWKNGKTRTGAIDNANVVELFKKLSSIRKDTLTNKAEDGNGNIVGILAVLNHEYSYATPAENREESAIDSVNIIQKIGLKMNNIHSDTAYYLPDLDD